MGGQCPSVWNHNQPNLKVHRPQDYYPDLGTMRFLWFAVSAFAILLALISQSKAMHMVDSSLGCADGSRCWCFMQRALATEEGGMAQHFLRGVEPAAGPCITCPDKSKCCCAGKKINRTTTTGPNKSSPTLHITLFRN